MQYFIKEWSDNMASLVAEDEFTLATFENIVEAAESCSFECSLEPEYIESYSDYPDASSLDFESSYI